MASTVTSTPSDLTLSAGYNSTKSGKISWTAPTLPDGVTIKSCVLTGKATASSDKVSSIKINDKSITVSTSGYNFTIDLGKDNSITSVTATMTKSERWKTHTVNFTNMIYTVTYELASVSYTVTFKDWDGSVLKTQTVASGGSATPPNDPVRDGYRFTGWSGSYTNITANTDITAQYIKIYSIVASAGTGGTISPSGTTTVDEGSSQTYTISADSGYEISSILVDDVSQTISSTYTFTNVQSDHTIQVSFTMSSETPIYNIKYKLIQCTVSDNTITTVQDGSSFNTTITPVDGRTIEEFTIRILMGGVDITQSVVSFSSNNYTVSIPNVSGDIEIIAYVGTLVTIAQGAVDGSVGDGSFMGSDHDLYSKSIRTDYIDISRYSSITMHVNDPAGFAAYNRYNSTKSYVNSTDLGPIVSGLYTYNTISDDNYIIFDMVHKDAYNYDDLRDAPEISVEDYICSYEFVSKVLYHTITVTHNEGGTADCDPTIEVEDGSSITITFTPNEGYRLSDVKVDNVSQGAITTYTFSNVTSGHTIQAVFEAISTVKNIKIGNSTIDKLYLGTSQIVKVYLGDILLYSNSTRGN